MNSERPIFFSAAEPAATAAVQADGTCLEQLRQRHQERVAKRRQIADLCEKAIIRH
ncbi:hypothetical protein [Sphingomonas morindae]|uniref:Uncharacterized protein n=1 Tax=Sphingomonas morindae TaxID=1541170 RepID=A0ABY4XAS7_9SPHN|nr:hypothetical protein [Sphingomonas morindae]USI74047.1 hypothetical protein LHA26_06180 [Sphingomonas morindae]